MSDDTARPRGASSALSRRTFLGGALSIPAGAWLAGCGGDGGGAPGGGEARGAPVAAEAYEPADVPRRATPDPALRSWATVRGLFDLDPGLQHLSAYILAPHSRPVREAIARFRAGMDRDPRGGFLPYESSGEARAAVGAARHLRTDAGLVALTDSTTMGLGLMLTGLRLGEGDEVVASAHEHYAASEALRFAADRSGARLRRVRLYPPAAPEQATVQGILAAYRRALTPATRAMLVTWVHSSSGVRLPLREIADLVAAENRGRADDERILLFVDAAHALGTGPVDVAALGVDALIAGCHKWLAGPRGTGLVWASSAAWQRVRPAIPSFDRRLYGAWMGGEQGSAPPGRTATPGGYHAFEHRWALRDAFDLFDAIGPRRIAARIDTLADGLREGLRGARTVRLHVPKERALHSGVVCFTPEKVDVYDAAQQVFDSEGVRASVTPYGEELLRLGTSWMNTEAEVEAAVRAVRALA